ncbi:hypothetical protein [Amphibacillus indicireducens]|uniref:Sporulation lipoprotein YhcN/YlaJ (Spore_YhcN_YlaJ) n=1 Tax=Amphibacillus indicireducens TaxID=1076330 RepID=A0ABP7VP23_9BACI
MQSKKNDLLLLFCSTLIFLVSCQNNQATPPANQERINTQPISYLDQDEHQVNQSVRNEFNQIAELTSVTYNQEIIMAIQVNQLAQFNEQKIAEEVEAYIEETFPNKQAKVSSDYKIFLEINRLKQEITQVNFNSEDFNQAFKEIKKLMKTPKD